MNVPAFLVVGLCCLIQEYVGLQKSFEHIPYKELAQGPIKGGLRTSRLGRTFYAYEKIPYAEPPVGKLRFRAPVKAGKWKGVLDASKGEVQCPQRNIGGMNGPRFILSGKEDCLYLNVYTPVETVISPDVMPVLVWIHGGAFESGSAYTYLPTHLMDKNIVVVTMNYRLGPLGFLSAEDDVLPGNWGLKDQNMALRWVKENIKKFRGNPDMITIFGQSAGGASIHYHMVSPLSKGLFHRAISDSGTIFSAWAFGVPGRNRNNSLKMASFVNCPSSPSTKFLECLQKKPLATIIDTDVKFLEWFLDPMGAFKPNIERNALEGTAFLPEDPQTIMKSGGLADVPWLTGINDGDGALRVAGIYNDSRRVKELNDYFYEIVPMSLFYTHKTKNIKGVTKRLRNFYFKDFPITVGTLQQALDLWTDGWFLSGSDHAARLHRDYTKSQTYFYYFTYRGAVSFSMVFGDPTRNYGACHTDDMIFLSDVDHFFPPHEGYTKEDQNMMDIMVQMWTDFVIHGEPTPSNSTPFDFRWEPMKTDKIEYLSIKGQKQIQMTQELLPQRIQLWRELAIN